MGDLQDTIRHALTRLYALQNFGIKLGLETEEALLGFLGNPERAFAVVHVAGTNGKGSVCAMMEAVFRAAGMHTGLYTSPHLIRFNERIRVAGEAIADAELAGLLKLAEDAMTAAAAAPGGRQATFFEITTAMAFEHFRRRGVRMAVVETGMGGRLDATNVLRPLVSVITPVSLEHTEYLGRDLATIAGEKAGIIKPGRPVVCGRMSEEALEVVARVAREQGAPLIPAADAVSVRRISQGLDGQKVRIESAQGDYGTVVLPLLGRHQIENCAMAVAGVEQAAAAAGIEIPAEVVCAGLSATVWPGRCQIVSRDPPVIVDGAHNPGAARVLAETLRELLKKQPLGMVLGICRDKDAAGFVRQFAGMVKRGWAVPLRTERSLPAADLTAIMRRAGIEAAAVPSLRVGMQEAEAWAAGEGGAVCAAGSLFLAGEVLEIKAIPV